MKVLKNMTMLLINILKFVEIMLLLAYFFVTIFPNFIGFQPFVVASGSMEPEIHTGSIVYIDTDTKSDDINEGDVIAFSINNDKGAVTHRVVEKNDDDGYFVTKGDANKNRDFSPVKYEQLIGKVVSSIPCAGYIHTEITKSKNLVWIVGVVAIQFIIEYLIKNMEESKNEQEIK